MFKNAVGRILQVGEGAVFLAGFTVVFAVVFAAANALLGVWGGQPLFGGSHRANPVTQLAANGGAGLDAEPVVRRRQIEFPRGFAQVNVTSATVTLPDSKGINGVQRTDNNVYCFDLTFAPRVAVASANINNNATVGTVLGGGVPSVCPAGFRDAAAKTYAANDVTSTPRSDINVGIVFIGVGQDPRSHLMNGGVVPSCFYSTEVRGGPYRRAVGDLGAPDPRPTTPSGRQGPPLARPEGRAQRHFVGPAHRSGAP